MNLVNKKRLTIIFFCFILIFIVHKNILGFSPIGYIFNFYKNVVNGQILHIDFPFFFWRIEKSNDKTKMFESFIVNDRPISVTLDRNYNNVSIDAIKKMCEGTYSIEKNKSVYFFLCQNEKNTYLKPFKVVYKQNEFFIFIYDYDKKYDWIYKKIISYITKFYISYQENKETR